MQRILITGATGQIGSELTLALRDIHGGEQVVASGRKHPPSPAISESGPFVYLDVTNGKALAEVVSRHNIDTIFHLASLLSATAEAHPQLAWHVNMGGLTNVLEVARQQSCAVFFPSSIAAFGPTTPKEHTPQDTLQQPTTIYGITKLSGELLCNYYFRRFGVDCRGVRYPGLISYVTKPGGGTTDYAVEIFHAALAGKPFHCFLKPGTRLDMMYMPDAIQAAISLMKADNRTLTHRNGYNISAMNFTPEELAAVIRRHIPDFTIEYNIDPLRQTIADSWPHSMDDSAARKEWGWQPNFTLDEMVTDMLTHLPKTMNKRGNK
ncbi:MAG: L-threonine 3-dehydrogenase [Proteobacteria bacterium]|nr:L-threonine 3-dehydrogenase [Pseudomonadota bacterium]MBU1638931.1 L-threonine 3-dehydrogenase [Pseudomonadota bacterium]